MTYALAYVAIGLAVSVGLHRVNPTVFRRFEPEIVLLWPLLAVLLFMG